VVLTIHTDLQYSAQQIITNYVKNERADWGSAVIVEAKTGKIITAAEYPSVDPNVFSKATLLIVVRASFRQPSSQVRP